MGRKVTENREGLAEDRLHKFLYDPVSMLLDLLQPERQEQRMQSQAVLDPRNATTDPLHDQEGARLLHS